MTTKTFAQRVKNYLVEDEYIRTRLLADGDTLIRDAAIRPGWSLNRLAERMGCSSSYLSDVQRGRRLLSPKIFMKLHRTMKEQEGDLL